MSFTVYFFGQVRPYFPLNSEVHFLLCCTFIAASSFLLSLIILGSCFQRIFTTSVAIFWAPGLSDCPASAPQRGRRCQDVLFLPGKEPVVQRCFLNWHFCTGNLGSWFPRYAPHFLLSPLDPGLPSQLLSQVNSSVVGSFLSLRALGVHSPLEKFLQPRNIYYLSHTQGISVSSKNKCLWKRWRKLLHTRAPQPQNILSD